MAELLGNFLVENPSFELVKCTTFSKLKCHDVAGSSCSGGNFKFVVHKCVVFLGRAKKIQCNASSLSVAQTDKYPRLSTDNRRHGMRVATT